MSLMVLIVSGYAFGLDRGHELLIDKGLQIQAQINPLADPNNPGSFDLARFAQSNFTGVNTAGGANMNYLGSAPGLQWGRSVSVIYDNTSDNATTFVAWDLLFTPEILDAANMVGIQFSDEQSLTGDNLTEAVRMLSLWRTNYPTVIGFTNQSGGQETVSTLQAYMAAAQPDMLMMDSYPFLSQTLTPSPGGSPTGFYTALQKYRLLGLAGNNGTGTTPIPYGAYLQGFKLGTSFPDNGHVMSESEVRLGEFAPWTFGYKYTTLWYYNYTNLPKYPNIMFDGYGETSPTAVFTSYAETNRQSRNIGPTLVRLLSTGLYFIAGQHMNGSTPVNNTAPTSVTGWNSSVGPYITTIAATNYSGTNSNLRGDVFVGYFRPLRASDPNEPYFMILNGLTDPVADCAGTQQTIRLDFNFASSGITSLQRVNRDNGTIEVVPLTSDGGSLYHLNLVLPGGTGDMFKFNTGSAFVTGPAGGIWQDVTYQDNPVKANINSGTDKGGAAYTSNKPDNGTWTMSYNLAGTTSVSAFSAKYVKFLSAGPSAEKAGVLGGQDSSLVLKVSLSKYATSALWDPGTIGYTVSSGSSVQLKYSRDGVNFTSVYTSPTGNSSVHPSAMTLTFTGGTKTIYLAYVGTIGTGTQAYWNAASGGLTITPDPRVFDEWTDVIYDSPLPRPSSHDTIKANINGGTDTGGYANTVSAKPAVGDWTVAGFNLGGGNGAVNIWSAYGVEFTSSESIAAAWGHFDNTSLVLKLNLPEPINGLNWDMARFQIHTDHDSQVQARWSADGVNWTTCYTFPPLSDPIYDNGTYILPRILDIDVPSTSTLYLGWFGTLNNGERCRYATAETGAFLFHPTNKSNWNRVIYLLNADPDVPDDGTVKNYVNNGTDTGGYAYTSVKPASSPWVEDYDLHAGSGDNISVWSADYIAFVNGTTQSRSYGDDNSSLILRINLSDNISWATWHPARIAKWTDNGSVQLKYSTDGTNWTTLATPPEIPQDPDYPQYWWPSTLQMPIPGGTNVLYIGYFGTVPTIDGGQGGFQTETTGPLTFTPVLAGDYWWLVSYADNTTKNSVNSGTDVGGQAYSSTKPLTGDWTFHYNSGATPSTPLSIWAANSVTFKSDMVESIYTQDNSFVMKINLSWPVTSATWTPTRYYYSKADDISQVQLKYSTDGVIWTTCWTALNNGAQDPNNPNYTFPGTLNLTFASPTQTLYIAYTGTAGTGMAFWQAFDGSLTFYPAYALTRCVYVPETVKLDVNNGTGLGHYAYYSTKSTSWTEDYFFNDPPVNVWAGDYLQFNPGQIETVPWGTDNSTLIMRIDLSDNISAATWALPRIYRYIDNGGGVQLKYSADGVNWSIGYTMPDGGGYDNETIDFHTEVTMSFPSGTDKLYIGWFGTVPAGSGGHGMFQMESTGRLTFTPYVPGVTVTCTLSPLGDFSGSKDGIPVTVELRGGTTRQDNVTLDSGGNFSVTNVTPGTYNVWIKASHWLAVRLDGRDVGANPALGTISVPTNGDCDGDNEISSSDLSIVLSNMDSSGGPADLNGDGTVTTADLSIVLTKMDLVGAL